MASMAAMALNTQAVAARPALVVGIVVDGLQQEYIELLKEYFGEGGFNRLIKEGVMLQNVDYGTALDNEAATAMLYTGTSPSVNGIPSAAVYDTGKKQQRSIFLDPSKIGNYTDETLSPAAMLVSTLSDEIRIDGGGTGYVHSIAANAGQAIAMSGHAGNSAFWINDLTGKWASTTYYKDVPVSVTRHNFTSPLSTRMDTMAWTPSIAVGRYPDLPAYLREYPFKYTFSRNDKNRFKIFKTSALYNREAATMAIEYLQGMSLGKRQATDMINIGLTLQPYLYAKAADNRLELMDAYLRIDRDIARIFSAIDRSVGMDNALVFLAGTPVSSRSRRDDERWGIPYGEFSQRRALSLLNMYLMAIHGNGEWVNGFYGNQLYLNLKLIKERDKEVKIIRSDAADFLARMSGISNVFTIDDILSGRAGENAEALRRNTAVAYAGDLLIEVLPGWEVTDGSAKGVYQIVNRVATSSAPVFLMGASLKPERIETRVDARAIAPTICGILRIRPPNAATLQPLRF